MLCMSPRRSEEKHRRHFQWRDRTDTWRTHSRENYVVYVIYTSKSTKRAK